MVIPAPGFDPAATLKATADEKCTSLYGVPTMFIAEWSQPDHAAYDLSSVRTGIMAGSPCPATMMSKLIDAGIDEMTICYGMTETSPVTTQTRRDDSFERKVGTVGRVMPHLEVKVDAFAELKMADFGDAPVVPGDAARSHQAIEATVGQVLAAGAIPIVLGGDHSIAEPDLRACAAKHGPLGLVHFDTHTDTGAEVFGLEVSHGTPMYRLVQEGTVDPTRYVQIGLRGYWPGSKEFAWQSERGITSFFAHDVRSVGIEPIAEQTLEIVGEGPVFLSIDVDVLDPAFAPGTGTPEPGGLTSAELLWAARTVAAGLDVVGADVVEVIPTAVGSADVTALVAERVVREVLTGMAVRR